MQRGRRDWEQVGLVVIGATAAAPLLLLGAVVGLAEHLPKALPRCVHEELYWWRSARDFRQQMAALDDRS